MKKRLFILISLSALIVLLLGLVGCITKKLPSNEEFENNFYSTWMSSIKDDSKLMDIAIPGSHDSGSVGVNNFYETQQSGFADQLQGGVRYFDARVTYDGDTLKYIHGSSDGGGAKGLEFEQSLTEMLEFVQKNPSEIIIIDFQHTWKNAKLDVLKMLEKKIPIEKMATKTEFSSMDEMTIGELHKLKKNFVIVWRTWDLSDSTISGKPFIYSRDEFLYSPYNGDIHKKKIKELIAHYPNYFADAADNKNINKLFVLQGVRTGSVSGFVIIDLEKAFRQPINEFVRGIKDDAKQLSRVNIVMRDFIVDEIKGAESSVENIKSILSLNKYKSLVKDDMIEKFNSIVKY